MAAAQVSEGPAFGDRNTSAQCDQAPSRRWLRHKYLGNQLLGAEILQLDAIKHPPADGCGTSFTNGLSFSKAAVDFFKERPRSTSSFSKKPPPLQPKEKSNFGNHQ